MILPGQASLQYICTECLDCSYSTINNFLRLTLFLFALCKLVAILTAENDIFLHFLKDGCGQFAYIKKDAVARSIADPVVRDKFDTAIAKLLKKKDVRDYDFYAENVAFDVIGLLPAKHWISQAAEAVMDKYYPDGM